MIVLAWNSQQEVGKVQPGLGSEEEEASVKLSDGIDIYLVVMEFAACLDGVSSQHFGEVVEQLISVVELLQLICIGSECKTVKADALDSFGFRRERHDAWSSRANGETLGRQAYADSSLWFAQVIGVAQIAEAQFVHRSRAHCFCVAEAEQLRAA